jgi:hypothetical protein
MEDSPSPREIRCVDAGPQEILRAAESSRRIVQAMAEVAQVIGSAIGECLVRLGPHVLGRIELRGVSRKVMNVQPRMGGEERGDRMPSMDRAAVPEQVDRAPQMPEEVLEERADVETAESARATPEVERDASPFGRDHQPATDREAIVTVPVTHARRLPFGRPGPADVGNEQESTLIDEDEMGATSSDVFLSGASRPVSTGRWRPRPARRPGAPASGNSSPARSAPSRHAPGGTEPRTLGESVRLPAAASRAPSGTPHGARPVPATLQVGASASWPIAGVVPAWAWPRASEAPSAGTPATSERPSSPPLRPDGRRRRESDLTPRAESRDDGASPVAWEFQEVA